MATLTTAWANHIYNYLNKGTAPPTLSGHVYLRLFTDDPTDAGSFADEVSGGSYTGQDIAGFMGSPTNGVGTSTGAIAFSDMPAVTVTHWAKCKSAIGTADTDEMLESGALTEPASLGSGETFIIATGELDSNAA